MSEKKIKTETKKPNFLQEYLTLKSSKGDTSAFIVLHRMEREYDLDALDPEDIQYGVIVTDTDLAE